MTRAGYSSRTFLRLFNLNVSHYLRHDPRRARCSGARPRSFTSVKGDGVLLWPRQHFVRAAETLQDDDRLRVFALLIARGW